jgi:RNA polymerase sigma factor (TIGR02999 family)
MGDVQWRDRRHFFAAAAQTMRHILVDYAVRRNAQKRGGDFRKVPLDDWVLPSHENMDELITLDRAMKKLEKFDERLVRIVECRFFAGLTIEETAETLEVSDATVSRDWTRARAWLNRELTRDA